MSPSITKAEVAMLGRRAQQPVKAPGELLAVFVSGKLVNPLNASAWGWQKRSRIAKRWKEAVATALFEATGDLGRAGLVMRVHLSPKGTTAHAEDFVHDDYGEWPVRNWGTRPKVVHFLAHTGGRMDGDGLQAALKPVRDALVECGVISGDADKDGHVFTYAQRIDRTHRGVEIRVGLQP